MRFLTENKIKVKVFKCQCGKAKLMHAFPFEKEEKMIHAKLRREGYKSTIVNLIQSRKLELCFSCDAKI